MQNHVKEWEEHLGHRSNKYWQYMRCVNNLDLYTECLDEEPMYIPRVFRKDKTHYRTEEEKHVNEKMNFQRIKAEMEILRIRKDNYYQELELKDQEDELYFEREIEDKEIRDNIHEIWNASTKKDEEAIEEKWVMKIEGVRKSFKKDKIIMKVNDEKHATKTTNSARSHNFQLPKNPHHIPGKGALQQL